MYSDRPGLILAFHGCDEHIRDSVLYGKENLKLSTNPYDWLGSGIYFWENSPERAYKFIADLKDNPRKGTTKIQSPSVIGAIIDLENCLDLTEFKNLQILKQGYKTLVEILEAKNLSLPENKGDTNDLLLRFLDCAVIETIHEYISIDKKLDSVRGMFIEGDHAYPGSSFREKNHIQICIRNPNCIKGYFLPRKLSKF